MDDAPTAAYHEPRPTELDVSNRPTIPSPFDRTTLYEQIKIKRACSPVDLVKLAGECDQLLNLPSIEQARDDVHDEEIDCGDLFGSESLLVSLSLTSLSLSSRLSVQFNVFASRVHRSSNIKSDSNLIHARQR